VLLVGGASHCVDTVGSTRDRTEGGRVNTFQKIAGAANKVVIAALKVPVLDKAAGKTMVMITYTGRKSGKSFTLPVGYKKKGDELLIGVAMPDQKNWWRNFSGEGGPISVKLDGVERTGHAVSHRNERGQVSVKVTLDQLAP
jgi:hypothetical protein